MGNNERPAYRNCKTQRKLAKHFFARVKMQVLEHLLCVCVQFKTAENPQVLRSPQHRASSQASHGFIGGW